MLADKVTQVREGSVGIDDIDQLLHKYLSEELAALIDEVEVIIDDNVSDKNRGDSKKTPRSPINFVVVSKGRVTRFWLDVQINHPSTSKKTLAFSGVLITGFGLIYQYLYTHSEQVLKILQNLLGGS